MASRTVYRAIWIPSALAIVGMVIAFAQQPMAIPKPTEMKSFVSSDKTMSLQRPSNWKARSLSLQGLQTEVSFEPVPNFRIEFATDFQGSLIADIGKSGDTAMLSNIPGMESIVDKQKSPLERAHDMQGKLWQKKLGKKEYAEEKAQKTQIANLEGLVSDVTFKNDGILSGKTEMIGKRYSALSGERLVTIFYRCPKEGRKEIEPTFTKMIESLKIGEGGG